MLRAFGGVVLGYLAIIAAVTACRTSFCFGFQPDQIFETDSFKPSVFFLAAMFVVSALATLLGGFVCRVVSNADRAVLALAGLYVVFELVFGAISLQAADPALRTGEVSPTEAVRRAREPVWYSFSLPFVGAAGVLVGGRLKKSP